MIYLNIYLCSLILVLLSFMIKKQKIKIYLYFITIILISILSGIRWKTGTDWDSYYNLFSFGGNLYQYMNYYHYEYLFKFLNFLGNKLIGNYSIYLFIITFLTLLLKTMIFIKRPYILMFFLFLFGLTLLDMFPTRQSLAMSISILSIYYYSENKYIKFIILLVLASMIHVSSFIILLIIFIRNFSLLKIFIIGVVFSLIIILVLSNQYVLLLFVTLKPNIIEQYETYISSSQNFNLIALSYKIIVIVIVFKVYPLISINLTRFEILSIKFYILGMVINILTSIILPSVFIRLSFPLISFEFIALTVISYYIVQNTRNLFTKITIMVLLFMYCLVRFYGSFANYSDLYYPYETIFDTEYKKVY